MANATANRDRYVIGKEGRDVHLPVAASTHIYAQTMVVQITATGMVTNHGVANTGVVIGVAQHEVDNTGAAGAKRVAVETDREYVFDNAGSNSVSEATPFGTPLYAVDNQTLATTGTVFAGTFHGMEPNGKVRVMIHNHNAMLAAALAS
jgi:hypothetical protein